jgi:hypothetical protein
VLVLLGQRRQLSQTIEDERKTHLTRWIAGKMPGQRVDEGWRLEQGAELRAEVATYFR